MRPDMTKVMLYTIPAVAISVAASQALADGTHKDKDRTASANATQQANGGQAGYAAKSADKRSWQPMRSMEKDMRVSRIIGTEVVGSNGEKIGEVEDLLIDVQGGRATFAVVQSDELFEVDEMMAIPLDRAHGGMRAGKFVLDATKEQMRGFRRFTKDAWPDWDRRTADGQAMRYKRASELLDADLRDHSGEDIGNVEDIVVNLSTGKLRYTVAEFDPSWFEAGKLVAVPLKNVRAEDRDGTDLVVTMSREALRNAPAFDRDNWPDLNDNTFADRVARFDAR